MLRVATLALAACLCVATAAEARPEAAQPSLASAVATAKAHMVKRFSIGGLYSVRGARSARDPSWVVVTGYYRRPRARPNWWAAYLRPRGSAWRVVWSGRGFAASEPKVRAPCDIWPPLSEPSC
ncbi:MAG: hypothetical protein ACXWZY_08320 [Gaiellaceae bacterium]